MTDWLNRLLDLKNEFQLAWNRIAMAKSQIWDIVGRHPELQQDATDTFSALVTAAQNKSVSGIVSFALAVQKTVTDAELAYTSEASAIQAVLAQLKALAN